MIVLLLREIGIFGIVPGMFLLNIIFSSIVLIARCKKAESKEAVCAIQERWEKLVRCSGDLAFFSGLFLSLWSCSHVLWIHVSGWDWPAFYALVAACMVHLWAGVGVCIIGRGIILIKASYRLFVK